MKAAKITTADFVVLFICVFNLKNLSGEKIHVWFTQRKGGRLPTLSVTQFLKKITSFTPFRELRNADFGMRN